MKNPAPKIELMGFKTMATKKKNTKSATPYYLSTNERKELLSLGDACFIVFSYYLEKAAVEGFDFDDGRVASALCYDIQKVKRTRITLKKNGWFHQSIFTNKNGLKIKMTYLGKTVVRSYYTDKQFFDRLRQTTEDYI